MANDKEGNSLDDFLKEGNSPSPGPKIDDITLSDIQTPTPPQKDKPVFKENAGRNWRNSFTKPKSLLLSDKMLPPITRKVIATYETLQEEKIDRRVIEGDNIILPPPIDLPPTYMVDDRFEQTLGMNWKLMKNVTRSESKMIRQGNGEMSPEIVEVLEYVSFVNGQIVVNTRSQYMLYAWLELHPLNASNKFRDQNKKSAFRRTDFDHKSSHVQMLSMDLQAEADRYVKGLNHKELINLASAMFNPTIPTVNVPPGDIAYALRLRARNNPEEVLFKNPDKKAAVRIDVLHALEMGVLEFHSERNSYYFTGDENNPVHTVAMDTNPLEDISAYLASAEGKEDYALMMEYVNYWK